MTVCYWCGAKDTLADVGKELDDGKYKMVQCSKCKNAYYVLNKEKVNKPKQMTNEEYLRSLNTEQLAEFISKIDMPFMDKTPFPCGDLIECNKNCGLYSRCARIAKEMGYKKIITYILETEDGTSLKASGWYCEAKKCGGGGWNVPSRPREIVVHTLFGDEEKYPIGKKQRWAKDL